MNINNQEICFVFAIDDKYFEQFRVFIFSLHTHNNWISDNNFFVLFSSSTLSLNNREKLKLECRERYLLELEWISCDDYISNTLKISSSDHVSVSTYFRLFLQELIPNNFSYALYLDIDILVVGDILNLYSKKIEKPIAAVENYAASEAIRLWGAKGGSYFNAGVLYFNLSLCRSLNLTQKYFEVLNNKNIKLNCWDQDVLNIVHENNWERLEYYFNITRHLLESFQIVNLNFFKKIEKNKFKIIHYDGPNKPWSKYSSGHYDYWWNLYYYKLHKKKHSSDKHMFNYLNYLILFLKSLNKIRILNKLISAGK